MKEAVEWQMTDLVVYATDSLPQEGKSQTPEEGTIREEQARIS